MVLQLVLVGDHGLEAIKWTLDRSIEAGRATVLQPKLRAVGRWIIRVDFIDRENWQWK